MRRAVAITILLLGCQAQAAIGASCTRPSDCDAPLTCALGRCRPQCADSRDCPLGARCIGGDTLAPVCTLDEENHCDAHVCPSPLMCVNDQCRTTCEQSTECVAGPCAMGTCMEPTSDDASDAGPTSDAGPASDAYVPATPCQLTTLAPVEFAEMVLPTEVTIATSQTTAGAGFVHVGVVAGSTTSTRALSVLTTVASLGPNQFTSSTGPVIDDLSANVFHALAPISIALRDNHGDARHVEPYVDILAIFDGLVDDTGNGIEGAFGVMQPGRVPFGDHTIVHETTVLCAVGAISSSTTCMAATTHPRPGRVLVVGGAFGVLPRFVHRWDDGSGLTLRSYNADDLSGMDVITPATDGYLAATDIDFGGSAGRFLAMPGPAAGDIAVWDATTVGGAPQTFAAQNATGRVAIAASDADHYVLAFEDGSTSGRGTIRVATMACVGACTTPAYGTASSPPSNAIYELPSSTETPSGGDVALAYVAHVVGSPDQVMLEVFSSSLGRRTSAPISVYTATAAAPSIVDLQIASVADGGVVTFDLAVLHDGTDGGRLALAGATAAGCY